MSIEENTVSSEIFKFCKINLGDILKEINNLDRAIVPKVLKVELWGTFPLNGYH